MYRHLSQFVVKVADLAEAEGRELRAIVARMGMGFTIALTASALLLAGLLLILLAVWLGLHETVSRAWASAITGLLALGLAGAGFAVVHRLMK